MTKPPAYTEAPYDKHGNLCHYPDDGNQWVPHPNQDQHAEGCLCKVKVGPEWRPIVPFVGTLTYDGYGRGRSAAYLYWRDTTTQIRYPMFMTDLDAILEAGAILSGITGGARICGQFTIIKRGQNYGIKWIGAAT